MSERSFRSQCICTFPSLQIYIPPKRNFYKPCKQIASIISQCINPKTPNPYIKPTSPKATPASLAPSSHSQYDLTPLINKKTNRHHRHNLEIPNSQPNPEPSEPFFRPHSPRRLSDPKSMSVADCATDLHAPSDDFKGIGCCLGDKACDAAREEFGPVG